MTHPSHTRPKSTCKKRTYGTKAHARRVIRKWGGRRAQKAYRCKDCGSWHITSMTKADLTPTMRYEREGWE